jgi:dolichol-phosphate mannosyltransferase
MAPQLSVVVPVYGCGPSLAELHRRTAAALDALGVSFELVLVDDCAGDCAWDVMRELATADPRVRGVRLSRNFGQHAAITAGLAQARGAHVAVMDCDLQDPPEELGKLYAKATEGHDIVLGRRTSSRHHAGRRIGSRAYFRVMSAFTGLPFDGSFGTFSVISRKVVVAFLQFQDQDRHYLFILNWLGFDRAVVDYDHRERPVGKSSYSPLRLINHALDGVFFQTTVALRMIVFVGFLMAGAGAILAVYLVSARLTESAAPGWTSLAVFTLTTGGFTIISTGITGIYVGKVFDQVKGRPLFVVDRTTWAPQDDSPEAEAVLPEQVREHA